VLVTDDGKIALLDLGMVARIAPRVQEHLPQLLLAISEGQSDAAVTFALKLGETREDFDEPEFSRRVSDLIGQHQDAELRNIHVGRAVLELGRAAGDVGLRLPTELALLGKTLLNLDQIAESLDPKFNPTASIRRNAAEIMRARLVKSASSGNLFSSILEMKDFVERLPARVNKILDAVANNQLSVKVDAIDEMRLMAGFQHHGSPARRAHPRRGPTHAHRDILSDPWLSRARHHLLPVGGRGRGCADVEYSLQGRVSIPGAWESAYGAVGAERNWMLMRRSA
jgi:predicted unusual protein kinase regulating ubiquinone biosynthesis (AarF/ABC1/UbiB family)